MIEPADGCVAQQGSEHGSDVDCSFERSSNWNDCGEGSNWNACGEGNELIIVKDEVFAQEKEVEEAKMKELDITSSSTSAAAQSESLPELEVPRYGTKCTQDPLWAQLRSP